MRKIVLYSLLLILAACSGSDKKETRSGFEVRGKLSHAMGNISLSEFTSSGLLFIDSVQIAKDGSFSLHGSLPEKTFCVLRFPKGDLLLVVDTNSSITLDINADSIPAYSVIGGPENDQMKTVYLMNDQAEKAIRKLYTENILIYGDGVPPQSVKESYQMRFDSIVSSSKLQIKQLVEGMHKSIVPYFVTNFLMIEPDYDYFKKMDAMLYADFSNSKYAVNLHNRVADLARTAIGAEAPDIQMNDPFGKQVALSSLRGKYVLIDFWASWCGPCREEIPNVVRAYAKYKSKGFEIFSVSLDDNREAWEKAINSEKMLWTHAGDLMKWNSPIVKQYNIEAIPYTLLLDKEGKIIAQNLRGESLNSKLKEIFGF